MPSAGVLPWLQGMICTMDNPCLSQPTLGETPGQVNNFNNTTYGRTLPPTSPPERRRRRRRL